MNPVTGTIELSPSQLVGLRLGLGLGLGLEEQTGIRASSPCTQDAGSVWLTIHLPDSRKYMRSPWAGTRVEGASDFRWTSHLPYPLAPLSTDAGQGLGKDFSQGIACVRVI